MRVNIEAKREELMAKHRDATGRVDVAKAMAELSEYEFGAMGGGGAGMALEDLSVYRLADQLSDRVWDIVVPWDWFAKKTVGDQLVRAADSIVANIAEGYGRYFFGEYIQFLYYSRGSVHETRVWCEKALKRKLITPEVYQELKAILDRLPLEINKVVKIVRSREREWKHGNR